MYLNKLSLFNFRNFEKFEYKFEKLTTLVTGPNGSGKSNFLESIYLLATTRSPRTKKDEELIFWGKDFVRVEGEIGDKEQGTRNKETTNKNLAIIIQKSQKKLKINGKTKSTLDFLGNFFAVLFSPQDLNLLIGSPLGRRRFLNQLTVMLDKNFLLILVDYQKALRHRNKLLSNKALLSEFEYWDKILIENGAKIIAFRSKIVAQLNRFLAKSKLSITYLPSPRAVRELDSLGALESATALAEIFREKLERLHEKERELGFTLIGPQRDEWRVEKSKIKNQKSKIDLGTFGSRGEQRMATVALKLAQFELLKETTGFSPALLLDDVFSELDSKNRVKLLRNLSNQQTIITTTQKENLPPDLFPQSQILNLG